MLVHINIGSNQNKEQNIKTALHLLSEKFDKMITSSIHKSPAVGFDGDDFYNVGVNLETNLEVETLLQVLREIENKIGRDRNLPKFSPRTIDLDIIFYGDKMIKILNIPRADVLKYQFVLTPFMEIIGKPL